MKGLPIGTVSALVTAIVLAGCLGQTSSDATTAVAKTTTETSRTSADDPTAAAREDVAAAVASLPADATDTVVARQAAPELPGPGHLVGLARGRVESLLGAPGFRRRDPPAEVWRYAGKSCRLFVYLYARPDDAEDYRVAHVEVRGASVVKVSDDACFHSLLKRRPTEG